MAQSQQNMASLTNDAAVSSSSSSTDHQNHYTYEVFLSFRGEDTRYNFTDHLHTALCQRGIKTFRDDKLSRGEDISQELLKAIDESRVSIVVFSQNYASSRWCLDELVKILDCKKSKGQKFIPVFYKVAPSDVRKQTGDFGGAFAKIDQCKYEDSMGKWKAALNEAGNLSGWTYEEDRYESKFINDIVEELSAQVINPSYDLHVAEHPIGLESCIQAVNSLLKAEENIVRMVGIWGTGGIGKTTIAKAVFKSIRHTFQGSCFLAEVRSSSSSTSNGLAQLQQRLLLDILSDRTLTVSNVDEGIGFIREKMRHKTVLLVLDDVSDYSQLLNFAPSSHCFGPGSRILITTRDKGWLTDRADAVYEVKFLNDEQALELFSLHAFQKKGPPDDYLELAQHAVHYAGGLPLALTVLGSHLFPRSRDEWEATLHSCTGEDPHIKIRNILKISYDALGVALKGCFLDIACFFKGKYVDKVKPILGARYNLISNYGIPQLEEKALIRIDGKEKWMGGMIWMHDLIEEMGKDIVYQESPGEPEKRSRLWNYSNIDHVLTHNTGTKKIEGIEVQWEPWNQGDYEICLNPKSFSEMENLMYFSSSGFVEYSGNIDYLPKELRWLNWSGCPIQSFPSNFYPRKLVALNIPKSPHITRLWEGVQNFPHLTHMDLRGCKSLTKLPDFTRIRNLKELNLDGCENLIEVHQSVGSLHKLVTLNLGGCYNLVNLPSKISLKSLLALDLSDCTRLEEFPKIIEKMDSLKKLILSCTGVKELHPSIENLIGLNQLCLVDCKNLTTLLCSIYELQNLVLLDVSGCSKLVTFPEIKGKMDSLRELNLRGSGIIELHQSFGNLIGLNQLCLVDCKSLTTLPCSICELQNLEILDVSGCSKFVTFPEIKGKMNSLKKLSLRGSGIAELHPSIGNLIGLNELYLDGCEDLTTIPCGIYELQNLDILDVSGCSNLVTFPTKASISHDHDSGSLALPKLRVLRIKGCKLSTADFIGSLDCLDTLTELDLSSNNFVTVPALGKFVNLPKIDLRCCKRLREILELPPNILEVNASDCESLERFLILPRSLNMVEMNLWNCHRFSYNLCYDMEMMEKILLNNQKSPFRLVLPGSEVPKWFHRSKEVAANESSSCAIEIPSTLNWENIGLAVCSVEETYSTDDRADISINGVLIHQCANWPRTTEADMRLTYIPLSDEIKGKVDQQGWWSYNCQVSFHHFRMKSCGVHLVCNHRRNIQIRL